MTILKLLGIMVLGGIGAIALLQLIFVLSLHSFNKIMVESGVDPLSPEEAAKSLRGEWD